MFINEEKNDEKVDIYSFGILMFEILEKKYYEIPLQDFDKAQIISGKLRPNLSTHNVDSALSLYIDLMKMCWESNKKNRPRSFSEIKTKLVGVIERNEQLNPSV